MDNIYLFLLCGLTGCVLALKDCSDHYNAGSSTDGVYTITPAGSTSFQVYCEMSTGAWTRFQHREDGHENFFRNYADYQSGFGVLKEEHWLGNNHINALTKQSQYKLRVDFTLDNGTQLYAEYSSFSVSSQSDGYRLNVSGFSGTAKSDALTFHSGRIFYTYDHDKPNHCSSAYHGAWWYKNCHSSNLNGKFRYDRKCNIPPSTGSNKDSACITWWNLLGHGGFVQPIRTVTMKIKDSKDTAVPELPIKEANFQVRLIGEILSEDNVSIPAGCGDEYAVSLKQKALIITGSVNTLLSLDQLCAGIPAVNISHVSTVITIYGHQGMAVVTFLQPGNALLSSSSQNHCITAIGRYLQDHANWFRPLINVVPGCPVVYFTQEMFCLIMDKVCS